MKALVGLLAALVVSTASARTGVPVVDYVDVPVSLATSKPVSAAQIEAAFVQAALIEAWDVEKVGDGELRLTHIKDHTHTVRVKVTYSASAYSVVYLDSKEMDFYPADGPYRPLSGAPNVAEDALKDQIALFARYGESAHSAARPGTLIHPFYQWWVMDLLQGVRRQLRAPR